MRRDLSRRSVVAGTGIALTGLVGVGSQVMASEHEIPVDIVEVNPTRETVVLENSGSEDIDLSGYQIDWEYLNDNEDQTNAFDDGTSIGAGAQLVVWTGYQSSTIDGVQADVTMRENVGDAPSDALINDDGNDVIALLSPSGEVIVTSDGEVQAPEPEPPQDDGGDDGGSNEGSEGSEGTDEESGDGGSETEDESGEQEEADQEESDSEETEEETGDESNEDSTEGESDESGGDDESEGSGTEEDSSEGITEYEVTLTGDAHDLETDASGYGYFVGDSEAGEIDYTLEAEYLCNATQAHIHLGGEDESGPVVAWLYPEEGQEPELIEGRFDGVLGEGALTEDHLVGEWEGASIEEAMAVLDEGGAYVNIHTEEYPSGEIRGQIGILDSL